MYLGSFILVLFSLSISIGGDRAQKADPGRLQRIKRLLNEQVVREVALIQNDGIDVFADLRRDPLAKPHQSELTVNDPDNYFDGDVDLSETQANLIEKEATSEEIRVKRKIGRTPLYNLWDRSQPISFDFAETIPRSTRAKIRDAMRLWQRHTCVRFEEGGPNVDRIEFFDGGGCSSFVGRVGGTQGVSISTPGCDVVGIISHEIGHALGTFHEQARPDQNHHISVNYNNIPIKRWNNFQPVDKQQADTYDLPYDTGSVMHYGPYGFASDPYIPTIRTLDRTQQSTIGQRAGPAFLDYQAINVAYGCTDHCPSLPCMRGGYPNPNNCSQCLCPDGYTGRFCEDIRRSNAECGGRLPMTREPHFVTSPNFPYFFPKNSECYWLLTAPPGGRVFLQFVDKFEFYCEDTCDKSYVEIKYHNDKRLTGARYCCSSMPKTTFISFKEEMLLILRGYGGASAGFRAKIWSDVDPPQIVLPKPLPTSHFLVPSIAPTTLQPFTTEQTAIPSTTTIFTTHSTTERRTEKLSIKPTPQPVLTTKKSPRVTTSITQHSRTSTTVPPSTSSSSTPSPETIISGAECGCREWSEWVGPCSQECGGCGHRIRKRLCEKNLCRTEEKRGCNFNVCPSNTNFLINNGEFHILWRGCCVGQFRSGDQCTALENNDNPFLKIISSLLTINDAKNNVTMKLDKERHGEHR